ncbi:hypothetical protein GBF38_020211 [Nibea albiflora]|uniref:Uncharacterized protein n=1 Tax=Nibea albiflora TaxID=240163 RepID=A0ACB7FD34_NIBAL|nr:hypothetical protein GBF38_020211 [Nibea albiflora]
MGAKVAKGGRELTPMEQVIKRQPDHEKQIQSCVRKWHRRTTGKLQWPEDGTFVAAFCNEVEASIKHYKAKDTSSGREAKRASEREVLRWFRQEGRRQILDVKQMPVTQRGEEPPAMLLERPPPYYGQSTPDPAKSQGYQCPVRGAAEGELTGKIQLTWTATQQDTNDVDRESFLSDRVSVATESTDREITQLESVVHQDNQGQSKRTHVQQFSKPVGGSSPAGVATSVSCKGKYEEAVSEEVARMKEREQYVDAQRKREYGRREDGLHVDLRAQPSEPPVVRKKLLLQSQSQKEEPYDMRASHPLESPYAQKGHQRGMKELEELEVEMNKLENLEQEVANIMESLVETRQT